MASQFLGGSFVQCDHVLKGFGETIEGGVFKGWFCKQILFLYTGVYQFQIVTQKNRIWFYHTIPDKYSFFFFVFLSSFKLFQSTIFDTTQYYVAILLFKWANHLAAMALNTLIMSSLIF